jgi:serine/threonine protein kinase
VVGGCYELIEQIGGGAGGTVWRALSQATGEEVAIKLLREELVPQPKAVMRFVQERAILAALRHENIVPVRELLTIGESLGLVMDLVPGGSLRDMLRRRGTLTPAEAATMMAAVADGLAHAHHLGVVHRDLKPDNILVGTTDALDRDPEVRLTDFGIARVIDAPALTTAGALLGTPNYLAPEVIHGGRPSPASDVYAFGMVLYELLTGRPPYGGHTPRSVIRRHVETRPRRNPGIPDVLWKLITSCVEKTPSRRPEAATLGVALRTAALRLGATPALPRQHRLPMQSALTAGQPFVPSQRRRSPAWHAITTVVTSFVLMAAALIAFEWPIPGSGTTAQADRPSASPHPSPSAAKGGKPVRAGQPIATDPARLTANRLGKPVPAKPRTSEEARVAPLPTVFGAAHCTGFQWKFLQPAFSNTCYATGPGVRISGALRSKEVTADITLTLKDAAGKQVGDAYTCKRLTFAKEMSERTCGPFELTPPRGRRYVLVQSWRVYDNDGSAILGEAKSAEFAF